MAATSSCHEHPSGADVVEDAGGSSEQSSGKRAAAGRVEADREAGARAEGASPSMDEAAESIASGIASVLGPVVRTCGNRVDDALKSQRVLETSINRLTIELDQLLDATPLPLEAQQAARLPGIRKRVSSLSGTLHTIQDRIDKMNRMLSKKSEESQQ